MPHGKSINKVVKDELAREENILGSILNMIFFRLTFSPKQGRCSVYDLFGAHQYDSLLCGWKNAS